MNTQQFYSHKFEFFSSELLCKEKLDYITNVSTIHKLVLNNSKRKKEDELLNRFNWSMITNNKIIVYTHSIFPIQTNKKQVLQLCQLVQQYGIIVFDLLKIFGRSDEAIKFLIWYGLYYYP